MAKNLIGKVMTEAKKNNGPTKEMIEKIQSGYLVDRGTKFRKKKSFSPSTLVYGHGECARYWYQAFDGAEFTDDADAYAVANMSNGTLSHGRIEKAMLDGGYLVEDEVKVIHDDPPIFGYADGIAEWNDELIAVEIKTAREEAFQYRKQSNKPPTYNLEQLIYYMKVLKLAKGVLIYESKNSHELHIIHVEINDEYVRWVDKSFDWMRNVYKAWEDRTLPERTYRSNSKICKGCPLKEQCFAGDKGDVRIEPLEHLPK